MSNACIFTHTRAPLENATELLQRKKNYLTFSAAVQNRQNTCACSIFAQSVQSVQLRSHWQNFPFIAAVVGKIDFKIFAIQVSTTKKNNCKMIKSLQRLSNVKWKC